MDAGGRQVSVRLACVLKATIIPAGRDRQGTARVKGAGMKRFKRPRDIRVAVIGYGGRYGMGRQHINEMKEAGMTAVAACDLDEARLEEARADFEGIETYRSADALLKKSEADLVTIITPHNTHAGLALKCLGAGRHVVCEKPFAITTDECDRMIGAAKRKKLMLSTYHNRHWDGCILRAVREIRKGVIGEVYRIEAHMGGWGHPGDAWRSSKSKSGGILYDWGVHLLEYSLQIVNSETVEVSGFAKKGVWAKETVWKKDTNEDEGFAVVRFRNGVWLTLCITRLDMNPKQGQLEITGTKGTYVFSNKTWETTTRENGAVVVKRGANPPSEGRRFYRNVADHLTKGKALVITPEWARRPIEILDLADGSAKAGKALRVRR